MQKPFLVIAKDRDEKILKCLRTSSPKSVKPVFHSRISPPLAKNVISCSFVPSAKIKISNDWTSKTNFFSDGGGEMMEWKTACLYVWHR